MTKHSKSASNYSRRDTLRMIALGGAAGIFAPNLLERIPPSAKRLHEFPRAGLSSGSRKNPRSLIR